MADATIVKSITGQTLSIGDIANQIKNLGINENTLSNIENILNQFSADSVGTNGVATYSGGETARDTAVKAAKNFGLDILDGTPRGQLLSSETVQNAIRGAAQKYFMGEQGLGRTAASAMGRRGRSIGYAMWFGFLTPSLKAHCRKFSDIVRELATCIVVFSAIKVLFSTKPSSEIRIYFGRHILGTMFFAIKV